MLKPVSENQLALVELPSIGHHRACTRGFASRTNYHEALSPDTEPKLSPSLRLRKDSVCSAEQNTYNRRRISVTSRTQDKQMNAIPRAFQVLKICKTQRQLNWHMAQFESGFWYAYIWNGAGVVSRMGGGDGILYQGAYKLHNPNVWHQKRDCFVF